MPGNETQYETARAYFPATWNKENITAGQTTGVPMDIAGIGLKSLPFAEKASVVSVAIVLSDAVTAGFIRFELTKNGNPTGKTVDMNATTGTKKLWEFPPGKLVANKGDEIGFLWGSSGSLAPSGSIEAVLLVEVQEGG
jgi:hypothetical protein